MSYSIKETQICLCFKFLVNNPRANKLISQRWTVKTDYTKKFPFLWRFLTQTNHIILTSSAHAIRKVFMTCIIWPVLWVFSSLTSRAQKSPKFHNMVLIISGSCKSHWIITSPHYVDIWTPRERGSLWRLSCNWE